MISFAVIGADGRIEKTGSCPAALLELQGATAIETAGNVSAETHYFNGSEIVALPNDLLGVPYQMMDGAPVADLASVRSRQRAIINAARNAAQDGGCDTPSGFFDTAPRSREFLNGAVTSALLAQLNSAAFSIDWTLADNSTVTMNATQTIAAGLAVAAHVDAMHHRATVLKGRIDDAETLAAITAITWTLSD